MLGWMTDQVTLASEQEPEEFAEEGGLEGVERGGRVEVAEDPDQQGLRPCQTLRHLCHV